MVTFHSYVAVHQINTIRSHKTIIFLWFPLFSDVEPEGWQVISQEFCQVEVEGFNEEGRAVSFDAKGWQAWDLWELQPSRGMVIPLLHYMDTCVYV